MWNIGLLAALMAVGPWFLGPGKQKGVRISQACSPIEWLPVGICSIFALQSLLGIQDNRNPAVDLDPVYTLKLITLLVATARNNRQEQQLPELQ